jgi:hypothetical protein
VLAVVDMGRKALPVLLHEEEVGEFRVGDRHGDEPGRAQREK